MKSLYFTTKLCIIVIVYLSGRCSARMGPKLRHRNMKEYLGKPANPPHHVDTQIRTEFNGHLNYNIRILQENFTTALENARQNFHVEFSRLEQLCAHRNEKAQNIIFQATSSSLARAADHTLLLSNITMNSGKAYNPTTGYFTAASRGVYSFIFSYVAEDDCKTHTTCTKLAINGKKHSKGCAEWLTPLSQHELVELGIGDTVSVLSDDLPLQDEFCSQQERLTSGYTSLTGQLVALLT